MTSTIPHLNIWFNRPFATTYWLIKMVKDNPDGVPVTVFATHPDLGSPVLLAADRVGGEPELSGTEYVDWCFQYCVENKIDVFVPRMGIADIVREVERFESAGVRVLASGFDDIELLEDKNKTYVKASRSGTPVPPWRVGSSAEEIQTGYDSLVSEIGDARVVMKPTVGVGAEGFRVIDNGEFTVDKLLGAGSREVSIDSIVNAYSMAEESGADRPEIMLLPFLEDPEVSVDVVSTGEGEIIKMIPRTKDSARLTSFSQRFPEAEEIVAYWYTNFNLRFLTNTQLRWWQGELVLLETNTRASGGLYSSNLTGLNVMWEAIVLLVNGEVNRTKPKLGLSYVGVNTFVETQYPFDK